MTQLLKYAMQSAAIMQELTKSQSMLKVGNL